jgi:hypothetical protein
MESTFGVEPPDEKDREGHVENVRRDGQGTGSKPAHTRDGYDDLVQRRASAFASWLDGMEPEEARAAWKKLKEEES